MCTRETFTFLLFLSILVILCFLFSALLALFTVELHMINRNLTLNPFGSKTQQKVTEKVYGTYPFTRGKNSVTKKYSRGFHRTCDNFQNCTFKIDVVTRLPSSSTIVEESDTLFLACDMKNKRCSCEEHWGIAHISTEQCWTLEWDDTDFVCRNSKGGPCGIQIGLKMDCDKSLQCINQRCRNPGEVGTGKLNESCYDDIDCEPVLVCQRPYTQNPPYRKQCMNIPMKKPSQEACFLHQESN